MDHHRETYKFLNDDLMSGDEEVRIEYPPERSRSRQRKQKQAPAFLRISGDFQNKMRQQQNRQGSRGKYSIKSQTGLGEIIKQFESLSNLAGST